MARSAFGNKKVRLFILVISSLTMLFLAGGEVFAATGTAKEKRQVSSLRQQFINYALGLQGAPYVYGGKISPQKGFDCSGFVTYSIRHGLGDCVGEKQRAELEKMIKAASAQQLYDKSNKIKPSEREPGDLIFFTNGGKVNHVGIYLGKYHSPRGKNPELEGKRVFISAVSDGPVTGVVIRSIDENYWKNHFYAYGRFIEKTQSR